MRGNVLGYSDFLLRRLKIDGKVRVHYKGQYKSSTIFTACHSLNSHIIFGIYIDICSIYSTVAFNLKKNACHVCERLKSFEVALRDVKRLYCYGVTSLCYCHICHMLVSTV